jgi:flagellar biosynthesis/type III secretory pathway chaperone
MEKNMSNEQLTQIELQRIIDEKNLLLKLLSTGNRRLIDEMRKVNVPAR